MTINLPASNIPSGATVNIMALPPEQINIKRRREEEPVETLYIQSDLHQKKRRFTDFVFHRVRIGGDGRYEPVGPSQPTGSTAKHGVRSPRSVSSFNFPTISSSARGAAGAGGVPLVRATSPGAELREERLLAAARQEAQQRIRDALNSTPDHEAATPSDLARPATSGGAVSSASSAIDTPPSSPGKASSLRRFHISRSSTPLSLLKATGGGVQKRRPDVAPARAILVEKLARKPVSRKVSMLEDLARTGDATHDVNIVAKSTITEGRVQEPASTRRKRPVVNQAEKRWREQQKAAISTAKKHITETFDKDVRSRPDKVDDESERLAREFEQVARELDSQMDIQPTEAQEIPAPSATRNVLPKPALKYQPRSSNRPRKVTPEIESQQEKTIQEQKASDSIQVDPHQDEEDDSDGDYVYDTYIRRPLPAGSNLTNPLDAAMDSDAWYRRNGIDTTRNDIGVVVITQEDEEYWAPFAEEEDDEDKWDSEDADSNAEDNPANDYPDEELSSGDEYDDPTAIYNRYRNRAASDDEGYDVDGYDSEGELVTRLEQRLHQGLDSDGEIEDGRMKDW